MATYIIQSGDTFTTIAAKLGTTVAALEAANPGVVPTNLQIGQVINTSIQTPTNTTYTIVAGDTFTSIASKLGISVEALEAANPGVIPTNLQIGQVIQVPSSSGGPDRRGGGGEGSEVGQPYKHYSGPSSAFPPMSTWASYDYLWSKNSSLMLSAGHNTAAQVSMIGRAIDTVSRETGVDARAILCVIMQESGGNVHVGNTFNGVVNTGIMQAFNGSTFDEADQEGSILRMVRDGADRTANGPGLRVDLESCGWDYYVAFRIYNSGSATLENLSDGRGATVDYVEKMANRLCGHVWDRM